MKNGQNVAERDPGRLLAGDLTIEPGLRRVTRGSGEISLPGLSFDFLMALVGAAPNLLSTEELVEQVWDGQVVSPETITQRAKLLRDALGDDSQNPRYIAGVRGKGYRLVPAVMVVEGDESPVPRRLGTGWQWAALFAAIAVAVAIVIALGGRPPSPPSDSLAVLPFENRSASVEDVFFADGIHDDLLARLSRIRGLRVIARGSVLGYRDSSKPIPEIARDLGVAAILTGAVQRAGDQVRVQVQLLDAARNQQIWAETYDRALTVENVFAIQSEISDAIASKLALTLRPADRERIEQPLTSSLAAYDAWLQGRQAMNRYTAAGLAAAVERFQEALAADSEFAQAHVSLAETRLLQNRFRLLERDLAIQLAESSVERALALDPTLAEAFAVKGDVLRLRGDGRAAEDALRQAIALNPNLASAYISYGWLLGEEERTAEQMGMWARAAALDPHAPAVRVYGAFSDLRAGRLTEAESSLRTLLGTNPQFPPGHVILGEVLAARGDQATAATHYRQALDLNPSLPLAYAGLVHALLDLEEDLEAAAVVAEAWSVPATPTLAPSLEIEAAIATGGLRDRARRARLLEMIDLLRGPDPLAAAQAAATLHLQNDHAAAARDELESAEPRLREGFGTDSMTSRVREAACSYAAALSRLGETERARALARSAARSGADRPATPRGFETPVLCAVATGDIDGALELVKQEVSSGHLPSGWRGLLERPELESLRGHPRWPELADALQAEAARQRQARR